MLHLPIPSKSIHGPTSLRRKRVGRSGDDDGDQSAQATRAGDGLRAVENDLDDGDAGGG